MRTDIAYVNGLGERLELGGSSESLHYFEHGIRDWEWSWGEGVGGSVTGFSRRGDKPREVSLPVGIAAATGAEGMDLRNLVESIGEYDVLSGVAGRLLVGDWYLRCWLVGCEPTDYWMDDRFAEMGLTLLVEDPGWVREHATHLVPETGSDGSGTGFDYPHDFPLEFAREGVSKSVYVGGLEPRDFLWRAYGPCEDPWVRIGGDLHGVNVDVPAGHRLEVDSRSRTAVLVSPDGSTQGVYDMRVPGAEGSGTYLFERVPLGESSLSWDNSHELDFVTYEVRSSCPWEAA